MTGWILVGLFAAWVCFLVYLDRDPNSLICSAIRDAKCPRHNARRQRDNDCYEALTRTHKMDDMDK